MKTEFESIVVGPISDALGGGKQVELRQGVKRLYDDSNSIADSLFSGTRAAFSETRVTWRAIPDDATPEMIKEEIAKYPEARLMRILSEKIILNDSQERLLKSGFQGPNADKAFADFKVRTGVKSTTWDKACQEAYLKTVENAQVVKYGENNADGKPADEAVLFNGKKQYRIIAFSKTAKADIDLRHELAVEENIVLTKAPITEEVAA